MSDDTLKITAIENNRKDKVQQPVLAQENIIPRINTSNLFIGSTGSGKSTLITNLLTKTNFYGGKRPDGQDWFDWKLLISPSGGSDDVQMAMELEDDEVITDLKEGVDVLQEILIEQSESVEDSGADKAPLGLIMFDDTVSHSRFTNSAAVGRAVIANRHHNLTIFFASQVWTKVPRPIRLQARCIMYYESSQSEVDLLCEEYCPPGLNRYDFNNLVQYCTQDLYSFLFINKNVPIKERFRKNFDEVLNINSFKNSKTNPQFSLPKPQEESKDEKSKQTEDYKDENQETNGVNPDDYPQAVVTLRQHGSARQNAYSNSQFGRTNYEQRSQTSNFANQQKKRNPGFGSRLIESSYLA